MDEYLHRNDQGIMIRDGNRQGGDRRGGIDRRTPRAFEAHGRLNRRLSFARREPGERRIGPACSRITLFHEHLSAFILGGFLILAGICLLIAGLTFLPIIGLYAGAAVILVGAGFLVQSFRSNWPAV